MVKVVFIIIIILGMLYLFLSYFSRRKKKLNQKVRSKVKSDCSIDLESFNDSIAEKISWNRKGNSSSGRPDREIFMIGQHRLELRMKKEVIITIFSINLLWIIIFSFLSISGQLPSPKDIDKTNFENYAVFLIPLFMMIASVIIYLILRKPIVFDKKIGKFGKSGGKNTVKVENIHAIQMTSHIKRGRRGWLSVLYELNIVMSDGNRHYLIAHPNSASMKSDAKIISEFLDVPLWDRTE